MALWLNNKLMSPSADLSSVNMNSETMMKILRNIVLSIFGFLIIHVSSLSVVSVYLFVLAQRSSVYKQHAYTSTRRRFQEASEARWR